MSRGSTSRNQESLNNAHGGTSRAPTQGFLDETGGQTHPAAPFAAGHCRR